MSRKRIHDEEPRILGPELIEEGIELCKKATQVNGWYPHTAEKGHGVTVRGPFCRWFKVLSGQQTYSEHLSSAMEDAYFAAHAMNNYRDALEMIKSLQEEIERLTETEEFEDV